MIRSDPIPPDEIVKAILRRYRSMVADYQSTVETYESMYPSITSTIKDVMLASSCGNSTETKMINILDHRAICLKSLHCKIEKIKEIEDAVESLPYEERTVIKQYYIIRPHKRIEEISPVIGISESTCWRAHRRGIRMLVEKMTLPDSDNLCFR